MVWNLKLSGSERKQLRVEIFKKEDKEKKKTIQNSSKNIIMLFYFFIFRIWKYIG